MSQKQRIATFSIASLILIIILITPLAAVNQNDIIILNSQNQFNQILKQFEKVLIYFYSDQQSCFYCCQFNTTYAMLPLYLGNQGGITFAKINHEGNEDLFRQEQVQAVPELRYYLKGKQSPVRYNQVEYGIQTIDEMKQWVRRINGSAIEGNTPSENAGLFSWFTLSPPKVPAANKNKRQEIQLNCGETNLINAFSKSNVYYSILDIPLTCGSLAEISYHSSSPHLPSSINLHYCLNKETQQLSQNCENNLWNIYNRGIKIYSDQQIHQIYHQPNNTGMFALITNNDTKSLQYLGVFHKIKKRWDRKAIMKGQEEKNVPLLPVFAVADIASEMDSLLITDIEECPANKLKKFVGGYQYTGWPYPYPILAFLTLNKNNVGGYPLKYLFQAKTINKSKKKTVDQTPSATLEQNMEEWMKRVLDGLERPYLRGTDEQVEGNYDEQDDQDDSPRGWVEDALHGGISRIYREQLQGIINYQLRKQSNNKQVIICYVYFYWRNDLAMQTIKNHFEPWWQKNYQRIKVPYFVFDLYENDFPTNIHADKLPAFVAYDSKGNIKILDEIHNSETIKEFVQENYSRDHPDHEK